MTNGDPFTLHRSLRSTVRVEPPDVVVVEIEGHEALRAQRSSIQRCELIESGPAVSVELAGRASLTVGPLTHRECFLIVEAINVARGKLLFAVPGFAITISDDDAQFSVHTVFPWRQTRPLRTTTYADFEVSSDTALPADVSPDQQFHIWTGLTPRDATVVDLVNVRGQRARLGPLTEGDAGELVRAFRAWRSVHPLHDIVQLTHHDLLVEPSRYHLQRIDVIGVWVSSMEVSRFANAWLDLHEVEGVYVPPWGVYRVRVIGTWIFPERTPDPGYGHMGGSPGLLRAETFEVLDVLWHHRSGRDIETNLLDRRALHGVFDRERAVAQRTGRPLACSLFDIDNLRGINAEHGYDAGDIVVERCARAIAESVRRHDIVARWAGEEFLVLLPDTSIDEARRLSDMIRECVHELEITVGGRAIQVRISVEVVAVGPDDTLEALTARHSAKNVEMV